MSETLFNLPLQPSIHWDDIRDNSGELVIQVYGDERHEATKAQRDYVIRAMNAHDDMLVALKAAHKLLTAEHFDSSDELVERCAEIVVVIAAAIAKAGTQ